MHPLPCIGPFGRDTALEDERTHRRRERWVVRDGDVRIIERPASRPPLSQAPAAGSWAYLDAFPLLGARTGDQRRGARFLHQHSSNTTAYSRQATLPKLRKLTAPLLGTDGAAFAVRCVTEMAPRLTEFAIVELYAPEDHAKALATILKRQGLRIAFFPPQLQLATLRRILGHKGNGECDIEELSIEPPVSVPLAQSCSPRKHAVKLKSRQELTARLAPTSSSRFLIYPSCAASPPNVRIFSSHHS